MLPDITWVLAVLTHFDLSVRIILIKTYGEGIEFEKLFIISANILGLFEFFFFGESSNKALVSLQFII